MEREILFRGKRTDNGEWAEGLIARICGDVSNIVIKEFDILVPVLSKTVGQFTGVTDKNGTKIFEGDILKSDYIKENYTVEFVQFSKNMLFGNATNGFYAKDKIGWYSHIISEKVEVIGTIYDEEQL